MWENETIVLVTSLKKRILEGKSSAPFSKIEADNGIPRVVKTMLRQRIERYIAQESPLTVRKTAHFDLKPSDLKQVKTKIMDICRSSASFPASEVEEVLQHALVLKLDYLVKPVDTMRRILFSGMDEKPLPEVEQALYLFLQSQPYAKQLLDECEKRSLLSLHRDDYTQIMTELLHQLSERNAIKWVMTDFTALAEGLSETKGEEIERLEGSILQAFFADRNLFGFRRALDVEMKLGRSEFDYGDLELTMKRYLEYKQEFMESETPAVQEPDTEKTVNRAAETEETIDLDFPEHEAAETEEKEKSAETVFEESPEPEPRPAGRADEGEDAWDLDSITKETEPEAATKEPETEDPGAGKPKTMRIIRREPRTEDEQKENKTEKARPAAEKQAADNGIRLYIDEKTEKVFIKKLFGGERETYEHLLNKLDESESWRVAKILIDNELFKRDVDPFSREAIKLVDLVYSLYYPEEGVGGKK